MIYKFKEPNESLKELYDTCNECLKYNNPSHLLNSICGKMHYVSPKYTLTKEKHIFTATVPIMNVDIIGEGKGTSSLLAKANASFDALSKILAREEDKDMHYKIIVNMLPTKVILSKRTQCDADIKSDSPKNETPLHICSICDAVLKDFSLISNYTRVERFSNDIVANEKAYEVFGISKFFKIGSYKLGCPRKNSAVDLLCLGTREDYTDFFINSLLKDLKSTAIGKSKALKVISISGDKIVKYNTQHESGISLIFLVCKSLSSYRSVLSQWSYPLEKKYLENNQFLNCLRYIRIWCNQEKIAECLDPIFIDTFLPKVFSPAKTICQNIAEVFKELKSYKLLKNAFYNDKDETAKMMQLKNYRFY